uniref:(3R)-3-hydroxyacyl-CoA dehydrogenase n=1 Tax=Amblyomma triste TaxID=251400 RepID=A0A023GDC6_AMBTT
MSLNGRLALVTGGAGGIGAAVCNTLATEGATVVVADKELETAKTVANSLPGDRKHCAVQVDVSDSQSVKQLFSIVISEIPLPLSILVNCAGIMRTASIVDTSDELFDEVVGVNLRGTFLVTREASREMTKPFTVLPKGGAAIVNVASIVAKTGACNSGAYAASKAGVVALTKTVAQELAPHGIRCNAVLPAWTDTPMTAILPAEIKVVCDGMTPLKRSAQPCEIAEAIKFLCSPTASSFVTGAALEVTGGFSM